MPSLISTLVDDFVNNQGTDALRDVIIEIAFLFEKANGWGRGLDAHEQMIQFGWTERVAQVDHTEVLGRDLDPLIDVLCQFILQAPTDPSVAAATWAVGKTGRDSLKPVLVAALRLQVLADPITIYQTMIALTNIGEHPFGDRTSMSLLDIEQNRQAALRYLQQSAR